MPTTIRVVTNASCTPTELFDVSLSIDAHVTSMSHTGERAIGGVASGQIALGEHVTWRARHFGIVFTMTSEITAFERPSRFVDQQTRGPFRSFHHEHLYAAVGDGCVMTDVLTFASPIGGRLVERTILGPYLRRLLETRNAELLRLIDEAKRHDLGRG